MCFGQHDVLRLHRLCSICLVVHSEELYLCDLKLNRSETAVCRLCVNTQVHNLNYIMCGIQAIMRLLQPHPSTHCVWVCTCLLEVNRQLIR